MKELGQIHLETVYHAFEMKDGEDMESVLVVCHMRIIFSKMKVLCDEVLFIPMEKHFLDLGSCKMRVDFLNLNTNPSWGVKPPLKRSLESDFIRRKGHRPCAGITGPNKLDTQTTWACDRLEFLQDVLIYPCIEAILDEGGEDDKGCSLVVLHETYATPGLG